MKNFLFIFSALVCTSSYAGEPNNEKNESASLCGPIPALCNPTTSAGGLGIGIYFVSLNQISNTSSNPPMLEDFTCTDSTWLIPGVAYNFEMHTGTVYEESATVWIDFGNDGTFDSTEIVYHDSAVIFMHQGLITVPLNAVHTFTPIRMRIGSEASGNFLNGCNDAYYGQYEDYTVYYGMGIGINAPANGSMIRISPNPFHSTAQLEIKSPLPIDLVNKMEPGNCVLKIYNLMGAPVRDEEIFHINPDSPRDYILRRDGLCDGLYFYELINSDRVSLGKGKFIIN